MGPIKPDVLVLRNVLNDCGSALGLQEMVWLWKPCKIDIGGPDKRKSVFLE